MLLGKHLLQCLIELLLEHFAYLKGLEEQIYWPETTLKPLWKYRKQMEYSSVNRAVYNHWTGPGGLHFLLITFVLSKQTHLPAMPSMVAWCTVITLKTTFYLHRLGASN